MSENSVKNITNDISVEYINSEVTSESKKVSKQNKFNKRHLDPEIKLRLSEIPEALDYIEKLERIIEKQIKKIIKWKNKARKKPKTKDAVIQTENIDFGTHCDYDNAGVISVPNDSSVILKDDKIEPSSSTKSFIEEIKEAAEIATRSSGFVYEETSGMYYDYNTGYYYNAEYGLYYDGNRGMYLKYNSETGIYEYHSEVVTMTEFIQQPVNKSKTKRKKSYKKNKAKDQKRPRPDNGSKDVEEGECSQSSEFSDSNGDDTDSSGISKQWPPCMRVIVESSENAKIKVGSLHVITCDGGSVGREGSHSILLQDINVSKHHLKITFDKETGKYLATDLGSRNGTFLDGERMSSSKQESEPMHVKHGSKIQIGSTALLCHIHEGNHTCGHCEPGLLQTKHPDVADRIDTTSTADKHKNELRKLKKQCGFFGSSDDNTKLATGYTDRARRRRETVGSQNPHEKTKMASIDESISSENKGFKLLSKMGWKEGQSLGKTGEGVVEPIKLVSNVGTAGIGAEGVVKPLIVNENKQNIWKKAQERFEKIPDFEEEPLG